MTQSSKPLTKSQSKQLISELFNTIPYQIQSGFNIAKDDLLEMNVAAEKKHRKGSYSKYNFSVNDAAKYFVIHHLFDACKAVDGEGHLYTVAAILHIRLECLKAQAYVMENKEKFTEWKKLVENSKFSELDYCELIK